ncbi:3-hydroxyacyl-ACP dehydratase FabZ [candidate division WOR-3 bacterium]|nr:3-hydroxyacyl-ACP dehydratase FabZ [candidate division WOR-3 bacterium]
MPDQNSLKIEEIMRLIPHRYPFLLVDRIIEISDDRVVGIKNVTMNEPFFQGHFPGNPIMPGVLIVESMAQTGGFLLLRKVENPDRKILLFLGIDAVKFRRAVVPGDTLRHELYLESYRHGVCVMKARSTVEGELACEGVLKAKLADR